MKKMRCLIASSQLLLSPKPLNPKPLFATSPELRDCGRPSGEVGDGGDAAASAPAPREKLGLGLGCEAKRHSCTRLAGS